jgi:alkanesulfonate monooxygenase SsuD/methylene tetrahydromethanopterin reductase-like flavin-dependent oxidoreductase (luciferase family)
MAMTKVVPFSVGRPKTETRGLKARATRFANDVDAFCDWYFTGTHRQQREKVNDKVRWLKHRAKQAGRTR